MRGDQATWSHLPGLGGISFPSRPITCDYRITTAKLRERALTGRPKTRRSRLNLKSAPPFQKRNPDNFPMPHNREDAVRSAKGHRDGKRAFLDTMNQVRKDSISLKQYSKQMFDVAVEHSDKDKYGYRKPSNASCLSTRTKTPVNNLTTNGPTADGSILYNKRTQVLNSIRIRPYSEPSLQFNHERSKTRPSLAEAMNQMTVIYKVRHSTTGSRPGSFFEGSSVTDYVFVPKNEEEDGRRKVTLDTTLSELDESYDIDKDGEVFDECDKFEDKDSKNYGNVLPGSRLLPATTPCTLKLVSLEDNDTDSEKSPDNVDGPGAGQVIQDSKKTEPPTKAQDKKPPGKAPLRSAGGSVVEPEPEKPARAKIVLKGPHCWVDDATVTSELSEPLPEESTSAPADDKAEKARETAAVKHSTQQVNQVENKPVENVTGLEEDIPKCDSSVVDLADVKEYELPSFLCPSSEKKSREAAIKDWLANTSFRFSNRTIPMV